MWKGRPDAARPAVGDVRGRDSWDPRRSYVGKDELRTAYNEEEARDGESAPLQFAELGLPVGKILGGYTVSYLRLLLRTYVASFPTQSVDRNTPLRRPVRHDCTSGVCSPFLEVDDDCLCRWSGNVHRCPSSGGCSESIIGTRNRVCTLTGRVTSIDETDVPLSVFQDYMAHGDDEGVQYTEQASTLDEDVDGQWNVAPKAAQSAPVPNAELLAPEASACAPEEQEPRTKRARIAQKGRICPAPGERSNLFSELRSTALGIVRRVLKRDTLSFEEDTDFCYDMIVEDNIMYLWTEVASTEHYKARSQSYPFHFHCLVILHEMINGFPLFGGNGELHHLIPKQPGFDALIPNVEAIQLGEFNRGRVLNHRSFIGACKFFKESIMEITTQRPHALQKLLARESTPRTRC